MSIIAIIIFLLVTYSIPLIIRSRGVILTRFQINLISITDVTLGTFISSIIIYLAFMNTGLVSSSGVVIIGPSILISFFVIRKILEPSPEMIAKKYPNAIKANEIIKKREEEDPLEFFANDVYLSILISYANKKELERKIIESGLSPQEYAYNDLISILEKKLDYVAYRDQNTHELNEKGQKLLEIQQKIIKDLENFRNPETTPSVVETVSSEPINVITAKTQNIAVETETKTTGFKINNAETTSNQVKSIVMDIDNKVGIEPFSERIAMPVWKKANDLDGIQTAFEKSGLTIEQFTFQSLIFEIDSVLTTSDDYFLAKQLTPVKQMLERNYRKSITKK